METTFSMMFAGVFVSNIVIAQFLGICAFLGVSKSISSALGMSAAVGFVMLMASSISWLVYTYCLVPFDITYLKTIAFILTIASLVQLVEMFLKKYSPAIHQSMGVYLPLITTNCAILGVALLNIQKNYSFYYSFVNAVANALGFALAMILMAGIRERLDEADLPEAMKGLPIALFTAGCMAIAMMGFAGIM